MRLLLLAVTVVSGPLLACSSASPPILVDPTAIAPPVLTTQTVPTTNLLQAVSVVSSEVVWVSGHGGTWARSEDGGASWTVGVVPRGDSLQFRDLHALDAKRAWLMSAGNGPASQIYYTEDGGQNWTQQFRNGSSQAFYDCMAFWDDKHGVAMSDGVDGFFPLLFTRNGKDWRLMAEAASPPARVGEGSFAASGTCLVARNDRFAWFGTGAAVDGQARVWRTTDRGETWRSADTPIASNASAGITSVAFRDTLHGVVLGGNIAKPDTTLMNVAVSSDGGVNWEEGTPPPFPGAVYGAAYSLDNGRSALVAVGPKGAAISWDDARSWTLIDTLNYWSVGMGKGGRGWMVGPGGRVRRIDPAPAK